MLLQDELDCAFANGRLRVVESLPALDCLIRQAISIRRVLQFDLLYLDAAFDVFDQLK
jgi:hypothetical protein